MYSNAQNVLKLSFAKVWLNLRVLKKIRCHSETMNIIARDASVYDTSMESLSTNLDTEVSTSIHLLQNLFL